LPQLLGEKRAFTSRIALDLVASKLNDTALILIT